MNLLLLPGYFGMPSAKLLEGLNRGGALRGVDWEREIPETDAPLNSATRVAWMLEVAEGGVRKSHLQARLAAGPRVTLVINAHGASAGRVLLDLKVTLSKEGDGTWADLEIALFGLACAALAAEDQGAVILGEDLHPTAMLNPSGTVAEQVQRTLDFNDGAVRTLLLAPATAASLGPASGFSEDRLGNLVRLCRGAP